MESVEFKIGETAKLDEKSGIDAEVEILSLSPFNMYAEVQFGDGDIIIVLTERLTKIYNGNKNPEALAEG